MSIFAWVENRTSSARSTNLKQPSYTLLKSAKHAKSTIDAGFTTVRDVGSRDHSIFTLKQAIESGLLPGPHIVGAGRAICMIGGHARFIGQEVEGTGESGRLWPSRSLPVQGSSNSSLPAAS